MESLHAPTHTDHDDPARLLKRLLRTRRTAARTWCAPRNRLWVLEPIGSGDGRRLVLSLLDEEMGVVCRASAAW